MKIGRNQSSTQYTRLSALIAGIMISVAILEFPETMRHLFEFCCQHDDSFDHNPYINCDLKREEDGAYCKLEMGEIKRLAIVPTRIYTKTLSTFR